MSNPFPTESLTANRPPLRMMADVDDDDDDAADDDDDDEGTASPQHEKWFSRSGFGSPEWWSR